MSAQRCPATAPGGTSREEQQASRRQRPYAPDGDTDEAAARSPGPRPAVPCRAADSLVQRLWGPAAALYRKGEVLYGLGAEPGRRALAGGARPVLVEGPLDAIAVTGAGGGRYAGVGPCGTALTAAQVAVLDTHAGPLADRGVIAAFDHDPGGRQAALRAYQLLAKTGAWPTTATLPEGQDPAGLAQHRGPAALRDALDIATTPLADLVVDERLARWSDRLRWGRRAARRRPRRRRADRDPFPRPDRPAGAARRRPARPRPRRPHPRRRRRGQPRR